MRNYSVGVLLGMSLILTGCVNDRPLTAKEQQDQEFRTNNLLNDTSPRNLNDIAKATPEFRETYNADTNQEVPYEPVEPDAYTLKQYTAEGNEI